MKILHLTREGATIHFNHWYTIDFVLSLKNFENVDVKLYGWRLHEYYPQDTLIPYSQNITFKDLKKLYDFDIIILPNCRRMHLLNDLKIMKNWLPKDFKQMNCLKVSLESDFHQHQPILRPTTMKFWKCGIKAVIHRHYNTTEMAKKQTPFLKHFWLPFSVDNTIFKPYNKTRINKACFVGHGVKRTEAIMKLKKANLLSEVKSFAYEQNYLDLLQKYTIYLNHSSKYDIDSAKSFEIIASGGILFTNNCNNKFKELFGDNVYFTYENNLSDLITKTQFILQHPKIQQTYIKNGLEIIDKNHTHQIRGQELLNILNLL